MLCTYKVEHWKLIIIHNCYNIKIIINKIVNRSCDVLTMSTTGNVRVTIVVENQ